MKKKKIHIEVDEELKKNLDAIRVEFGMSSTNELIRFILSEWLLKRTKE